MTMRLSLILVYFTLAVTLADLVPGFRPPAIPVFNLSPSLHGWLRGDALTDQALTNWFGTQNSSLTGYVKINGVSYRWMGIDVIPDGFINYLKGDANTDRAGNDLPGSPINMPDNATAVDCAVQCALSSDCEFWSFIPVGSGSCKQAVAQCSLRSGQTTAKQDTCRTSGVAPVHFNEDYVTGVPSSDMAGNDYREFDMDASATSYDCAKQCWADALCGGFVYAHAGCNGRRGTHCWLKTVSVTPSPTNDCRTSGFGPQKAGFSVPDWSYGTVPVIKQTSVRVQPTQTIFTFENDAIVLTVTFTQPAFVDDQLASSREQVYLTFDVRSNDGTAHDVQVYVDAASDLVTSYPSSSQDAVTWLNTSSTLQKVNPAAMGYMMRVPAAKPYSITGDYTRSNWGSAHLVTDSPRYLDSTAAGAEITRSAFFANTKLPNFDDNQPRVSLNAGKQTPVVAFVFDLSTDGQSSSSSVLTMFYDEGELINFFGNSLRPLWLRQYGSPINAVLAALHDYSSIKQRADKYDNDIITQMSELTSDKFASVLSLIHRQVTGSSVTVWSDQFQSPFVFIKEMSTGGFLQTVDVIYPASPLYLALGPESLRLMLLPLMHWCHNDTSNKVTVDYAVHDMGGYPVADTNAATQETMPVEESGNMLLMLAALAQRQDGDIVWLTPFRKVIDQWAGFLRDNLPDPEDQLCTDDFLGPSPHNINLATKGIVGMQAYSVLLRYWGDYAVADEWDQLAKQYAQQWKEMGLDSDKSMLPHYKQRYDQNSTWSTKYNLIWQYVLGTDAFPDDVRITENAFYQSQAHKYGIPLDNRNSEQKVDWLSWMGALAFDNPQQQGVIMDFIYTLANNSPAREPLTDLYNVENMDLHGGFIARFVLGGLYAIPMLNAQARAGNAAGLHNLDQVFPSSDASWKLASE